MRAFGAINDYENGVKSRGLNLLVFFELTESLKTLHQRRQILFLVWKNVTSRINRAGRNGRRLKRGYMKVNFKLVN